MPTLRFKTGDAIISEGDEGETAFLIILGTVEVRASPDRIGFGAGGC
jgi:hypothetical protein